MGGIFYYYFFPDALFVPFIDKLLKINGHNGRIVSQNGILAFLRNYVLDCLWAFSFYHFLFLMAVHNPKDKWIAFIIPVSVGSVLELLQKAGMITGTFDIWDIVVEAMGVLAAILVAKLYQEDIYEKD